MTSWRYLAWFPAIISSVLMYFSTPQMVHVQFECLPMMRFLLPVAQYGLTGIGTWSRLISTVLVSRGDGRRLSTNLRARTYTAKRFDLRGIFLLSDRKCVQHEKRAPDLVGAVEPRTEFARTLQNASFAALAFLRNSASASKRLSYAIQLWASDD